MCEFSGEREKVYVCVIAKKITNGSKRDTQIDTHDRVRKRKR